MVRTNDGREFRRNRQAINVDRSTPIDSQSLQQISPVGKSLPAPSQSFEFPELPRLCFPFRPGVTGSTGIAAPRIIAGENSGTAAPGSGSSSLSESVADPMVDAEAEPSVLIEVGVGSPVSEETTSSSKPAVVYSSRTVIGGVPEATAVLADVGPSSGVTEEPCSRPTARKTQREGATPKRYSERIKDRSPVSYKETRDKKSATAQKN